MYICRNCMQAFEFESQICPFCCSENIVYDCESLEEELLMESVSFGELKEELL